MKLSIYYRKPDIMALLFDKLGKFFNPYDDIYRDLNDLGVDYHVSTIVDLGFLNSSF